MGAKESKDAAPGDADAPALNPAPAPPVVKLADAKRKWQENPVPPIRLEDVVPPEERVQSSASLDDSSTASRTNLWQVYALGMFLIARWVYGRYKEGKDRGSDGSSTTDD